VPKNTKIGSIHMAQRLLSLQGSEFGREPMPRRKRRAKSVAVHHRDQHSQMLLAILYLCGVLLLINAWLVSQQLISF
jgi:hypothetical protein